MKRPSSEIRFDDSKLDLPVMERSTALGAKGIFFRFVLIAVSINAAIAVSIVIYDVVDSTRATRDTLKSRGMLLANVALRMRHNSRETDQEVVKRAAALTENPMALLTYKGELRFSSIPGMAPMLGRVYPGKPTLGERYAVRGDLGPVSGMWIIKRFSSRHNLLVIVPHEPADEGLVQYMTVAAGLMGMALVMSIMIMLVAANWMLHRPLSRLVARLTQALAKDINRRRKAEEQAVAAQFEAEDHLAFRNNLINASEAMGILAADLEGRIRICSRAAQRILGHETADLEGEKLDELRRRSQVLSSDVAAAFPLPAEGEELWLDKNGEGHLLDIEINDIIDGDGNRRGQLLTFVDVTEKRKLEAELQLNELQLIQSAKMATLGEMATGVAHELNQPLNNIGLLATRISRRLKQQQLGPEERDFYRDKLSKVQQQVDRASKIIGHMRTFSRPKAEQLANISVHVPVDGVMVFLREQLTEHGIEIVLDLPEDLPLAVADEAQLEQVLMNLIINARDALDEQGTWNDQEKKICISAELGSFADGSSQIALLVSDNGRGIPREVADRIFEPFFSTKEVGKGTGLGLSISYGLVKKFGGELEVSSRGQGTTFFIRLRSGAQE